jgi:hypothetical protein
MTVTSEGTRTDSPKGQRRGSSLSDRQVAHAVKDGKAVTATLATGDKVEGWIFGSDDFHWSIVTREHDVYLVHKSSPALLIHRDSSIETADKAVQAMVSTYRDSVLRTHFNHTSPQS